MTDDNKTTSGVRFTPEIEEQGAKIVEEILSRIQISGDMEAALSVLDPEIENSVSCEDYLQLLRYVISELLITLKDLRESLK